MIGGDQMLDYEDMILEKQEAFEACENCSGDCQGCIHAGYCPDYSEDSVWKEVKTVG